MWNRHGYVINKKTPAIIHFNFKNFVFSYLSNISLDGQPKLNLVINPLKGSKKSECTQRWTRNTNFPYYTKVKCSCETCCKLKGHKVKKQLPLTYVEKFLSIPRLNFQCIHNIFILCTVIKTPNYVYVYTKHNTFMNSFADILGHILLMDVQNKLR